MLRTYLIKLSKPMLACLALGSLGMALTSSTAQAVSVPVKNFRGTWNSTIAYHARDVVSYKTQRFIAQTANRNQSPPANPTIWYPLVAQAIPGETGASGPQGPEGATGPVDPAPKHYEIGDRGPGQGIVFSVRPDGLHGLEAAPSDQSSGIQWFNGSNIFTGAVLDGLNGERNTDRIISSQGGGSYAALICANYTGGGYGDWYLPSKYELMLLYQQKHVVGGFAIVPYWSSTEVGDGFAWLQYFGNGYQYYYGKNYTLRVRAIRAF
jgi:Protein of unknown function (DUF1566)